VHGERVPTPCSEREAVVVRRAAEPVTDEQRGGEPEPYRALAAEAELRDALSSEEDVEVELSLEGAGGGGGGIASVVVAAGAGAGVAGVDGVDVTVAGVGFGLGFFFGFAASASWPARRSAAVTANVVSARNIVFFPLRRRPTRTHRTVRFYTRSAFEIKLLRRLLPPAKCSLAPLELLDMCSVERARPPARAHSRKAPYA
jgi:hypothetical protein